MRIRRKADSSRCKRYCVFTPIMHALKPRLCAGKLAGKVGRVNQRVVRDRHGEVRHLENRLARRLGISAYSS